MMKAAEKDRVVFFLFSAGLFPDNIIFAKVSLATLLLFNVACFFSDLKLVTIKLYK